MSRHRAIWHTRTAVTSFGPWEKTGRQALSAASTRPFGRSRQMERGRWCWTWGTQKNRSTFVGCKIALLLVAIWSAAGQTIPDNLRPPADEKLLLHAHGVGDQVYVCKAGD